MSTLTTSSNYPSSSSSTNSAADSSSTTSSSSSSSSTTVFSSASFSSVPICARAYLRGYSNSKNYQNFVEGDVTFYQEERGGPCLIIGYVRGLSAGLHGLHVFEFGDITEGFKSAGNHWNPGNKKHGDINSSEKHMGDLGNIEAHSNGVAAFQLVCNSGLELSGENSIVGRSLIVSESMDDLGSTPSKESQTHGCSGAEVACGTIGLANRQFVEQANQIRLAMPAPFKQTMQKSYAHTPAQTPTTDLRFETEAESRIRNQAEKINTGNEASLFKISISKPENVETNRNQQQSQEQSQSQGLTDEQRLELIARLAESRTQRPKSVHFGIANQPAAAVAADPLESQHKYFTATGMKQTTPNHGGISREVLQSPPHQQHGGITATIKSNAENMENPIGTIQSGESNTQAK